MTTPLIRLYRLEAPDSEGRMLSDYWAWSHDTLEHRHDFIQWMFPLDAPSGVNHDAPLVSVNDRTAFATDATLRASLRRSLEVFLDFLGLSISADGRVTEAANFQQRLYIWECPNHNWMRITRMLKSLRLLGLEPEARQVWMCLKHLHQERGYVSADSFNYWADAAKGL